MFIHDFTYLPLDYFKFKFFLLSSLLLDLGSKAWMVA